jgi:N-acetylglutamate synthase-like GNAT family acetyltransferase
MPYTLRTAQAADWPAIADLLTRSALPLDGAAEHLSHFVLAEDAGQVIGAAGIEAYGAVGLLRSVVVDASQRGQGLGEALVQRALDQAAEDGIQQVALLTTTAMDYFPRFGFVRLERGALPAVLAESAEFRGACPDSAVAMLRNR